MEINIFHILPLILLLSDVTLMRFYLFYLRRGNHDEKKPGAII